MEGLLDGSLICIPRYIVVIFAYQSYILRVPAAREICFINKFVSSLCARVRLVPVVRGTILHITTRIHAYTFTHTCT